MEGKTYGVSPSRGNEGDVGLGDVVILKPRPEEIGGNWAYGLTQHLVDKVCRINTLETKHIALGVKPVAKVSTTNEEHLARWCDKIWTIDTHKGIWLWRGISNACRSTRER